MADEQKPSLWQRFVDWVRNNHEQQPDWHAQVRAMVREAVKDVNGTMHEVFFGKQQGMGEPGTPMVPTQAMVTLHGRR